MKLNNGTVALVTGGASGLGAATVQHLVEQGSRAVIVDRDAEKGEALAASLGAGVVFAHTDVTDTAQIAKAITAAQELGTLRVAVNCAGVGWAQRTVSRDGTPHDLAAFEKVIAINLVGSFNVLRQAASAMSSADPLDTGERGVIVNTASVAAYDGQIGQAAYAASKGGIVGMTLPIARDLSKACIRVMTIAPGLFDTPLLGSLPQKVRDVLSTNIPFPSRLGFVDEFAALVGAIVANPYLNGETIRLDGSLRMPPK